MQLVHTTHWRLLLAGDDAGGNVVYLVLVQINRAKQHTRTHLLLCLLLHWRSDGRSGGLTTVASTGTTTALIINTTSCTLVSIIVLIHALLHRLQELFLLDSLLTVIVDGLALHTDQHIEHTLEAVSRCVDGTVERIGAQGMEGLRYVHTVIDHEFIGESIGLLQFDPEETAFKVRSHLHAHLSSILHGHDGHGVQCSDAGAHEPLCCNLPCHFGSVGQNVEHCHVLELRYREARELAKQFIATRKLKVPCIEHVHAPIGVVGCLPEQEFKVGVGRWCTRCCSQVGSTQVTGTEIAATRITVAATGIIIVVVVVGAGTVAIVAIVGGNELHCCIIAVTVQQ